ncbi:type III pantothenate kinase [Planktosalinus lacus]|uniref:Type III pantothenate kinase n=1 Tax=Planktosalinus lacus TaxID=1526573 RepID=A0A8J2VA18_9FLAO|nr:type III pantothenate kinase [Planktosalinus lacus]GGD89937.1 type III pantothenate kinase [Planktosalinus lacus]
MNLVVDVGNTLVKMAVFSGKTIVYKKIVVKNDFDKTLDLVLEEFSEVRKAILSVVGSFSEKSTSRINKHFQTIYFTPESKMPFLNEYTTPKSLGVDRLALVSAAFDQFPGKNCLVIDMGTCVTYDFINSEGHYKGGAISPGINMRYKALNAFTERLPLLDVNAPENIIGNSTQTSIHSGVVFGISFEIDGVISQYKQENKDLTVILTGGNAHFLRDRLKNSIFANSNFLLEGLNFLLEYNQTA